VPKPAYYTYRLFGQVDSYLYLPLIVRGATAP